MPRKKWWAFTFAPATLVVLSGCDTTVYLSVENPTALPQTVRAVVEDANGASDNKDQNFGIIAPNNTGGPLTFDVKPGHIVKVTSKIPDGTTVYEEERTVGPDPDPLRLAMKIQPLASPVDQSSEQDKIFSVMKNLGPATNLPPIPLASALSSYLGGVICYSPPQGDANPKVFYRFTPNNFTNALTLDTFVYNSNQVKRSAVLTSSASVNLKASVPIYGAVDAQVGGSSLYRVEMVLDHFGAVVKPDPDGFDLGTRLSNLTVIQKRALADMFSAYPDGYCTYVTTVYAVKSGHFTIERGRKINSAVNITGASFITASGAYQLEDSNDNGIFLTDSVVNFDGISFRFTVNADKTITFQRPDQIQQPGTKAISNAIANDRRSADRLVLVGSGKTSFVADRQRLLLFAPVAHTQPLELQ